jgi:hypothetical protein
MWKIICLLLAILVLTIIFVGPKIFEQPVAELPNCGDEVTLTTLKSAVADAPTNKFLNVKLLEVTNPVELKWLAEEQVRTCRVTAFTNGGEEPLLFTMKWIDRPARKWYLQIVGSAP